MFASPNNPGALRVAKDLALATGNCIEVTSDETNSHDHPLFTLPQRQDVLRARPAARARRGASQGGRGASESSGSTIEIVTVHENDPERGGCEFGIFFDGRTPKDLVDGGIYNVRASLLPLCPSSCRLQPSRMPRHLTTRVRGNSLPRRQSRRRSTPGDSGRSLPRLWQRRWARPLPLALAHAASRLLRHCG